MDLITRLIADELRQLHAMTGAKTKKNACAFGTRRAWIMQAQESRRESFSAMREYRRLLQEQDLQQTVFSTLAAE